MKTSPSFSKLLAPFRMELQEGGEATVGMEQLLTDTQYCHSLTGPSRGTEVVFEITLVLILITTQQSYLTTL